MKQQALAPTRREDMPHMWWWLGRAFGFPCAVALVFWLVAILVVDGGNADVPHAPDLAIEAEGSILGPEAWSIAAVYQLLRLDEPWLSQAYWLSFRISLTTALLGGGISGLLVYGVLRKSIWPLARPALLFCARFARSFGAVPLAFATTAALGRSGLVATYLDAFFGVSLIQYGIRFGGFWALSLIYAVLQIPLCILSLAPALADFESEQRQHAAARAILIPALIATTVLLFGNAFAAQATTCGEYGCRLSWLPYLLVDQQRTSDVPVSAVLGYALSLRMVLTMALAVVTYAWIGTMSAGAKASIVAGLASAASRVLRGLVWLLR